MHGVLAAIIVRRSVVGEMDDERDAELDWSRVLAAPLKSFAH